MLRGGRQELPRAGLAVPTATAQHFGPLMLGALSCAAQGALSAPHLEDEDPSAQGSGFEWLCHITCSTMSHLLRGLLGVRCPVRSWHLRPAGGSGLVWLPFNRHLRTCKQSSPLSLGVGQRHGLPGASTSRSKSKGRAPRAPLFLWASLGWGWGGAGGRRLQESISQDPDWCLLLECPGQVLLVAAWQGHHGMQRLK